LTKLMWHETRPYEIGLDRGVYYPQSGSGKVWNGLSRIAETPTDSDQRVRYQDGIKVQQNRTSGYFSGEIEAYHYPDSFYEDVFTQTKAKPFGLTYRIQTDNGHKIHLVYNVLLGSTNYQYTQSGTEEFVWDFTTLPVEVPDAFKSAHIVIDTGLAHSWTVVALEEIIYGTDTKEASLPTPAEILQIFEDNSILQVIDNGDGSFTVIGPDSAIEMIDPTTFQITWPSAVYIDSVSYRISSL